VRWKEWDWNICYQWSMMMFNNDDDATRATPLQCIIIIIESFDNHTQSGGVNLDDTSSRYKK